MTNVAQAIEDLKQGKLIVVLDDLDRENEGDLIGIADTMTAESINFMITHGKGLLCAPMSKEIALRHNLPYMKKRKSDGTNFLISIDSMESTTGISALERLKTLKELSSEKPTDFMTPGHLFPLLAIQGGLSKRRGHTEAAVDLTKLAGASEVGAIIEIIKEDGEMARRDWLIKFANDNNLTFITIEDLVTYIEENRKDIWEFNSTNDFTFSEEAILPTKDGDLKIMIAKDILNDKDYSLIYKGELKALNNSFVRIHSQCLTSEVFGSLKCDCKFQLDKAKELIATEGGLIIYTPDEGRGIGLFEKINAYSKQDKEKLNTIEANHAIGFETDERKYDAVVSLMNQINIEEVKLLTNNPIKVQSLIDGGLKVERIEHWTNYDENATKYINDKIDKMGHIK